MFTYDTSKHKLRNGMKFKASNGSILTVGDTNNGNIQYKWSNSEWSTATVNDLHHWAGGKTVIDGGHYQKYVDRMKNA